MYSAVELWPRSAIASDDDDDDDNVKCKYDVNITYDIKVLQALVVWRARAVNSASGNRPLGYS